MTTLLELIQHIDEFDVEDVIFAKPEWNEDAEAQIFRLTADHHVPPEATALGFKYFLEVDVIRQVLEEFRNNADASLEVKCRRLIYYATFDA